jgi:hypothetical protein
MGTLLLGGLLFVPLGLALLVGAVVTIVKDRAAAARSVVATGRVIQVVHTNRVYCPIVEFTASTGQVVQFQSPFGTMPAMHEAGQAIAVRYDPAQPQMAWVDSDLTTWLIPAVLAGVGVLFLFMGAVFLAIGFLVPS